MGREPKVMAAAAELMEYCVEAGGTLSGEHGIGLEKKEFMPLVFTDDDMAAMRQARDAFAPENRLNPGKIFPDGTPPSIAPNRPTAPGMFI